ncbi:MAG: glycoside hydrolase [Deltaproteobacteria bacterium]|nr:glycoside hydrolase [Deltaproteobacteria bacterium]
MTRGSTDESSSGSGELPPVSSPVFVALADGGWTATSCDGGQTWVQQALSDKMGDHTPWTAFGGLAFGNDAFVAGLGWGAPGYLLYSSDGISWEPLPAERFMADGQVVGYDSYTAAVAFDGREFVAFSSLAWRSSTGTHWEQVDLQLPPGADQLRQLRGFDDGVLVAAVESQSGQGHPVGNFVVVTQDGGDSWTEGTGYDGACSGAIQHWGDIERADGVLLVGTRDVCRSLDLGQSWDVLVDPLGEDIQDLFADAQGFGAVAGSRVFHSDDGLSWTQVADVGSPLAKAAHGRDAWAAVGATGSEFFWSDDGLRWQPGTLQTPPGPDVYVRDMVVGYPSRGCP